MDPLTIGMGAMAALSAGGTALSIKGQLDQADTYSRLADVDTAVQQQQAGFVEEQGDQLFQQGYEQAKEVRSAGTRLQAEQRATVGGSGIKVDTGSPLLLAMESARMTELDALTTEYEGQRAKVLSRRDAAEFQRQAALTQYDKRLQKRSASQAAVGQTIGGILNIGSQLMSGGGPKMTGK